MSKGWLRFAELLSLNVLPRVSVDNLAHKRLRDAKAFSQLALGELPRQVPDLQNFLRSHLCPRRALSANDGSVQNAVKGILFDRSPSQMFWVAARSVSARMRRVHTGLRLRAVDSLTHHAMRWTLFIPNDDLTISCTPLAKGPRQALVAGVVNCGIQKLVGLSDLVYLAFSHSVSPHVCGQGRARVQPRLRPDLHSRITVCSQLGRFAA